MASRRTHVPKFGNWDSNDHMPYTAVFDHARQGRGKPINPNDPSENPNMLPAGKTNGAPGRRTYNPNDPDDLLEGPDLQQQHQERPTSQPVSREGSSRGQQERPSSQSGSREGSSRGHQQQPQQQPHQVAAGAAARRGPAPAQGNGMPSRAPPADPKRTGRENPYDRNVDGTSTSGFSADSPSHAAGRGTRLGAASPAWENRRKSASGEEGQMFAPATPNRSRLRAGGNNPNKEEAPTKGPSAALPKFGAWDAQDPGSGDGFTVIFNNARNEKKTGGPVNIPRAQEHNHPDLYEPANVGYQKGQGPKKNWLCCLSSDVKE